MFRFEYPYHLYALALMPVLWLVFLLYRAWRVRAFRRLGVPQLVEQQMSGLSNVRPWFKWVLWNLAFASLVVAWANPQWGMKREKVKSQGTDIILALDVSNSMLAEDLAPNRLERAKRFAQELIRWLPGDRIGILMFAGTAYLQTPLTNDYEALEISLSTSSPEAVSQQGTNIEAVVDLALQAFDPKSQLTRGLVIISDGENHETDPLEAVRKAKNRGLFTSTVAIGTSKGAPVPVYVNGVIDYKRDNTGNPVVSKPDFKKMEEMARAGDGVSYSLQQGNATIIKGLKNRFDTLSKLQFEQRSFSQFQSYFHYFLGLAFLLFLVEWLLGNKRSRFTRERELF